MRYVAGSRGPVINLYANGRMYVSRQPMVLIGLEPQGYVSMDTSHKPKVAMVREPGSSAYSLRLSKSNMVCVQGLLKHIGRRVPAATVSIPYKQVSAHALELDFSVLREVD